MPQVKIIQPIAEQAKKLRVAAYARVSSDSTDQLNSFATQVDYYTNYIHDVMYRGWITPKNITS